MPGLLGPKPVGFLWEGMGEAVEAVSNLSGLQSLGVVSSVQYLALWGWRQRNPGVVSEGDKGGGCKWGPWIGQFARERCGPRKLLAVSRN